jgi:sec-independent protein translocase protein TatA
MGTFSIWHWIIVLVVVLVLFGGGGKLSRIMGDAARGINAFKKGLKEDKAEGDGGAAAATADKSLKSDGGDAVSDSVKKDEAAKS